ncbi:MAG: hypothetical protein L0Y56_16950 [Nitrospira sp.]|nr:hypothetical protein [Nitrospira sp.]
MMKKGFLLCTLMVLIATGFTGCAVVVGPPHGRVVVAPAPPPRVVVIPARPRLVFIPEYSIYVAADVEYDLFYDGTVWFYFSDGRWYRGRDYNGPWVVVERGLPKVFVKVPPGQLKKRAFKEREFEDEGHDKKGHGRRFKD